MDDVIKTKVINVSRPEKKIGLSIRKLEQPSEKEIFKSYVNNRKEATSNLGDLLREGMMNLERQSVSNDSDSGAAANVEEIATESDKGESIPEKD